MPRIAIYNQMLKMDKNQIEAAADLGANPAQVFVKNIIPMMAMRRIANNISLHFFQVRTGGHGFSASEPLGWLVT